MDASIVDEGTVFRNLLNNDSNSQDGIATRYEIQDLEISISGAIRCVYPALSCSLAFNFECLSEKATIRDWF
jgi:hypothetical protein